jgi:hypothetical protein
VIAVHILSDLSEFVSDRSLLSLVRLLLFGGVVTTQAEK